jgi:hypothetical protein
MSELTPYQLRRLNEIMAEMDALVQQQRQRIQDFRDTASGIVMSELTPYQLRFNEIMAEMDAQRQRIQDFRDTMGAKAARALSADW